MKYFQKYTLSTLGLLLFILFLACSAENRKPTQPMLQPPVPIAEEDPAIAIIAGSNCKNCHNKRQKSIGPSYYEIARKYESDSLTVLTLVSKIKNGGSGNWGNVPMAAHPELRDEDIKSIVNYIVNLDK